MSCSEWELLFQQQCDGHAVEPSADLTWHLTVCAECRERQHAAERLHSGLRLLASPRPAPELTGRIVTQLLAERHRQRSQPSLRWLRVAAAVAALALLPMLHQLVPSALLPETAPPPQQAQRNIPRAEPASSLQASATEARQAVHALKDRLADQTLAQARLLWTAAPPMELPPMPDMPFDEPVAVSLRQTGAQVSANIPSVASSARSAVSFFLREMPRID